MTGSPFPPQHITDETGHGRHDVRVIRAAPATDAIQARWPRAAQMFLLERYRHPHGRHQRLPRRQPEPRAGPVRLRRGRTGTAPRLLATINNLVISVLNRAGRTSNARTRRELAWGRTGGLSALELLGL